MQNIYYTEADLKINVSNYYVVVSRFSGKIIYLSLDGQVKLKKCISSRLKEENIDRILSILFSVYCDQYFGVLGKYSQGK